MPRQDLPDSGGQPDRRSVAAPGDSAGFPSDVGDFRQGTAGSRWALSRYLVGRAIGADLSAALLAVGVLIVAAAVGLYFAVPIWLAVLVGLAGLGLLAAGALLGAVLRRVSESAEMGALQPRLRRLVHETRGDVRRELRRIGLPGHPWSVPLLGVRLAGRRRAATLQRLRHFEVERVVPAGRLDELHMVLGVRQPGSDPAPS